MFMIRACQVFDTGSSPVIHLHRKSATDIGSALPINAIVGISVTNNLLCTISCHCGFESRPMPK